MPPPTTKCLGRVFLALAVLCAAGYFSAAQAGPPSAVTLAQAEAAKVVEIEIRKRKVVGENVLRVTQGDVIDITWTTDEPVELHLHGYDVEAEAAPGKPAHMRVMARATGRFPVEAHGFGGGQGHHGESTLLYLEVLPK